MINLILSKELILNHYRFFGGTKKCKTSEKRIWYRYHYITDTQDDSVSALSTNTEYEP